MGGYNNNPMTIGFKSALKNLLAKQAITASKACNSLDCDSSTGVFALSWSKRTAPVHGDDDIDIPAELSSQLESLSNTSVHKDNILRYIAGFLVRRLHGVVKCEECAQALIAPSDRSVSDHGYIAATLPAGQLQQVKDRGGLVTATDPVFHIVRRCEQIIGMFVKTSSLLASQMPVSYCSFVFA
jgi:hypothetical protein